MAVVHPEALSDKGAIVKRSLRTKLLRYPPGLAALHRPGTHETLVWDGEAANKADALQCAEKADPVRIRHERILITGKILLNPQTPSDSVEGSSGVAY